MEYKNYGPASQCFLSDDDINEDEHRKSIFFNLDELKEKGTLNSTFDYLLKDWINDYITLLPITTPLFFDLIQNGKKYSYKATPEKLKTIIQCLKTYNFDQVIYDNPISSDPPANPDFEHVSGFGIRVYPMSHIHSYENRAGSFFNYLVKDNVPKCIEDQLHRYQIYSSLVNEKGERKEDLEDNCFVFALKMSRQFTEPVLNQIRLRIKNRFLPLKCIEEICFEFKIHLILHYLDDDRKRRLTLGNKKFIGVGEEEAAYVIEMSLYQKHYFIEEVTPFSGYYINNIETEKEENHMKEYDSKRNKYRTARYLLKSSDLITKLFNKEYFVPITYGHYMVLNTEFHKFQDSDSHTHTHRVCYIL